MTTRINTPLVIIVIGPTASGKTDFSEHLLESIPGQVINADLGQFYKPLSVGTAKPDWQHAAYKSHLFDSIGTPTDSSVMVYRQQVLNAVKAISACHEVPCIVGGSLFYIKSLFFPPKLIQPLQSAEEFDASALQLAALPQGDRGSQNRSPCGILKALPLVPSSVEGRVEGCEGSNGGVRTDVDDQALWNQLNEIDPVRAQALHPHDRYRVVRALAIWQTTGQLPSQQQPLYTPPFDAIIVSMDLPKELLRTRIEQRTKQMVLQGGWIQEAESLINTPWETFIHQKGFVGYDILFTWIRNGKPATGLDAVITTIAQNTWQYAKRQIVFSNMLKKQLMQAAAKDSSARIIFYSVTTGDKQEIDKVIDSVKSYAQNKSSI